MADEFNALSKMMGSGEAAALVYVKNQGGTVASNNLKDVKAYCEKNNLELIRTDDILCMAVIRGYISEADGQVIWDIMKNARRKLPSYDFNEAFRLFKG
jgi:predicted nucleic acid-binding protein